ASHDLTRLFQTIQTMKRKKRHPAQAARSPATPAWEVSRFDVPWRDASWLRTFDAAGENAAVQSRAGSSGQSRSAVETILEDSVRAVEIRRALLFIGADRGVVRPNQHGAALKRNRVETPSKQIVLVSITRDQSLCFA